jgi:hypothetical protein
MTGGLFALEVLAFGFVWWLGLYLISRDLRNPQLRYAGLGLAAYALGLALDSLASFATTPDLSTVLTRARWPFLFLPALLWIGTLIYILPEEHRWYRPFAGIFQYTILPAALIFWFLSTGSNLIVEITTDTARPGPLYLAMASLTLIPLLALVVAIGRVSKSAHPGRARAILLVCLLLFSLETGLLLFPLNWLPRSWLLLAMGADLIILGLVIAVMDAFNQGETLLPHIVHSFDTSAFAAVLFGGQIALMMLISGNTTLPMIALLFTVIATAIGTQTFSEPLQIWIDKVALSRFPRLRKARADLRAVENALPRLDPAPNFEALDEAEFARLTRRALTYFGDLPRLATSPLIYLPLIGARLSQRGAPDDILERAAELKALLSESIARLKPRSNGQFGTTGEWRHYNALYFPYVVGLKPYSRRATEDDLDPSAREALAWFQAQVPERTLYNWQTAAARLVAQDLRERMANHLN